MPEIVPEPVGPHVEMQRLLLRSLQHDVSTKWFTNGVATRIIAAALPEVAFEDTSSALGIDLVDRLFVPSIQLVGSPDSPQQEISMAVGIPEPETGALTDVVKYNVGSLDGVGIFYPMHHVNQDPEARSAANQVLNAALYFKKAREDGHLPNLTGDLLSIREPGDFSPPNPKRPF